MWGNHRQNEDNLQVAITPVSIEENSIFVVITRTCRNPAWSIPHPPPDIVRVSADKREPCSSPQSAVAHSRQHSVIYSIYSQRTYYDRVKGFLRSYRPMLRRKRPLKLWHLQSFFKAILHLGIINKGRRNFWKLLLWTSFTRPKLVPQAITLAIYGFHFRKSFQLG